MCVQITEWLTERETCSFVAGLAALIVGWVMWMSSLSIVRRKWYEFFYGVHHLYLVFVVLWLYHALWTLHFFILPVLLFLVDRFLRFLQSRHPVDVLSACILPSRAVLLRLAFDTPNIKAGFSTYHALSSWYLRFPSLSKFMKLEWHFFSVTSTPLDKRHQLSFIIKPTGNWTNTLHDQLLNSAHQSQPSCPFSFKAGVEGPYGDESDFFLR